MSEPRQGLLSRAWAGLDSPKAVTGLIIGYCLVHMLVRLGLSPVYSLDEAEQMLFAQDLNLGYRFRHPPLITWLVWAVQQAFGLERIAFFTLKYAIMAGGFVAFFFGARRILNDTRLGALATFAFSLTYTVGYYPHLDLMHTVLLTALLGAGVWAMARVLDEGAWADYLLYGAITALGILAKYVYGLFPAAVMIAVALTPAFRVQIKPARALASIALTLALLAPYIQWALTNNHSMVDLAQTMTEAESGGIDLGGWVTGTGMLAWSLVEFTLPFSLIFAALFWGQITGPRPARPGQERLHDYKRLLEIVMIAGALMMLSAVFIGGATHFKGRWMHQVLIVLPIYAFLLIRLADEPVPLGRLKAYGSIVAVAAALVIGVRIVSYEVNIANCSKCWEYQPFDRFADALRQQGFRKGTIVVSNMYVGGNLRAQFPDSRVVMRGYPLEVFPDPTIGGHCLIAWLGDKADIPAKLAPLRAKLGLDPLPEDHGRGRVRAKIAPQSKRWTILHYILMTDGPDGCR